MERNTLLAILLSAVVFFAYQAIFPAPKLPPKANNTQVIDNKEFANEPQNEAPLSGQNDIFSTASVKKAELYKIKSNNTDFSYSNVGGTLHNIDFIGNKMFPVSNILAIAGFENAPFAEKDLTDKTIVLSYQGNGLSIKKTYTLVDDNLINVRMEIKNYSTMSILNNFQIIPYEIDESRMDIAQNSRDNALLEYSVYANGKIFRKGNAIKFSDKNNKEVSGAINWIGFRDHYHALVIKPEFETKGYEIKADGDRQLVMSILPENKNLAPGESSIYDFSIYAGPQNPWLMKKYDKGFEKIVAFSNFIIVEWLAQGIYHIIPVFHGIFKSWGVSIILISVLIYGITYPLTLQSMMSMRKMQEAQPKINALRERYKDDPNKLNAEMMEIYRREKINPFGGCLPFLIQMPFFMALYQILWRAQYFQGQGFLWIKDLSQPDRLIIFPFYLPFLGNELNILPVLTGGLMFLQQRISTRNVVVVDEQQAMQQKMMMYILPVMMMVMFYKFASSWAIYFMVFYIFSTLSQWKIAQKAALKKA